MKLFFIRRWFLFALALVFTIGISLSGHLAWLSEITALRSTIVATVLFVMALPLKAGTIGRTLRRPGAPILASVLNYGFLPLFAWGLAIVLSTIGWLSDDMKLGVLVAAATPSTLASASVWTRRAGGNDAVSILVTVLTNLTCFIITPLWLFVMTGTDIRNDTNSQAFDLANMILKLGLLVVLPMTLAQLVRLVRPIGSWTTEYKTPLGVLAQFGVLSMIFLGAIGTGKEIAKHASGTSVLLDIAVAIALVLTIHVTFFIIGVRSARALRMPREDQVAVGFSGSQKTLMVGLEVSIHMGASPIPIVAYHVGQLLIDTIIADRFRRQTEELKN